MSGVNGMEKNKPDASLAMAVLRQKSGKDALEIRDDLRKLVIGEIQKVALETRTSGNRSQAQNDAIKNFTESVNDELKTLITGGGDILSVCTDYRAEVAEMVRKSLHVHIIGFIRAHGLFRDGNVFDPRHSRNLTPEDSRNRRLYIQEFMTMIYDIYILTGFDKAATEKLSRYHQPGYVKSLLDGSLIKQILNTNKFAWDEAKIESVFTPGMRLGIGRVRSKSIPDTITKLAKNYDALTEDAILRRINSRNGPRAREWTIDDVQKFFTSEVRVRTAFHYPNSVFEGISSIADVYESLTDEVVANIALDAGYSLTPAQIEEFVPFGVRKMAAVYYSDLKSPKSAQSALKQWMKGEITLSVGRFRPSFEKVVG